MSKVGKRLTNQIGLLRNSSIADIPGRFRADTELVVNIFKFFGRQIRKHNGNAWIRDYRWILIPLIVVGAVQLNAHLYYNTFFGYDMPQHFNNLYAITTTGTMPPPPDHPQEFIGYTEAFQAPTFYFLTAWLVSIGTRFLSQDAYASLIPLFLLLVSLFWFGVFCYLVQKTLRHTSPVLRALCVCVIALLPCNVIAGAMYNNDLPMGVAATISLIVLWLMARSRRYRDQTLWLRAAIFVGFSVLFKSSGIMIAFVYGAWAGCIVLGDILKHRWQAALTTVKCAAIGIPLIVIPLAMNLYHAGRYTSQPLGLGGGQLLTDSGWGLSLITFMTKFDTQVFALPIATPDAGHTSLWSRLYITLFSDPYNFWYSHSIDKYNVSPDRLAHAFAIVGWAIPVAFLIGVGFLSALYCSVRYPRRAMHDGSIILVIATCVSVALLLVLVGRYRSQVLLQSRYIVFLYPLLFVNGVLWAWKLFRKRYSLLIPGAKLALWGSLAGFCVAAIQFLWLQPA